MSQTTFEEAARCPKCKLPGNVRKSQPLPNKPGAKLHHIYCESKTCPWYNTCWMVQTNADGSVPPPQHHSGSPKVYVGFEGHDRLAAQLRAAMELDRKSTGEGGAEVRRGR